MQWRWAGRDRWPLSVTSPGRAYNRENKSYTGDAYYNLLYLRLSANYCLGQLVPGNSHDHVQYTVYKFLQFNFPYPRTVHLNEMVYHKKKILWGYDLFSVP